MPDDIVVPEAMTPTLDECGWARHRANLERRFGQDEVVVLANPVQQL